MCATPLGTVPSSHRDMILPSTRVPGHPTTRSLLSLPANTAGRPRSRVLDCGGCHQPSAGSCDVQTGPGSRGAVPGRWGGRACAEPRPSQRHPRLGSRVASRLPGQRGTGRGQWVCPPSAGHVATGQELWHSGLSKRNPKFTENPSTQGWSRTGTHPKEARDSGLISGYSGCSRGAQLSSQGPEL